MRHVSTITVVTAALLFIAAICERATLAQSRQTQAADTSGITIMQNGAVIAEHVTVLDMSLLDGLNDGSHILYCSKDVKPAQVDCVIHVTRPMITSNQSK